MQIRKRFLYGSVAKEHKGEKEYLEELEVIDTMLLQCYLLVPVGACQAGACFNVFRPVVGRPF